MNPRKPGTPAARFLVAALLIAAGSHATAAPPAHDEPQTAPPDVISLVSFGRSVANLEKAVAFYRDVLGMEMVEPLIPAPTSDRSIQRLVNLPGARFRSVHMRVPYTPISLELAEYSGVPQQPIQGNPGQPGIPWLTLSLKDDASFAGIELANPPRFSPFGSEEPGGRHTVAETPKRPLATEQPAVRPMPRLGFGAVRKLAFVRDVDGFLVEVMHRDPKSWFTVPNPIVLSEEGSVPIPGPIVVGLQFVLWERSEDAWKFYRELLGFDIRPGYTRSLQELYSLPDKLPSDSDCSDGSPRATMMDMAGQAPASGCWTAPPGPPGMAKPGKGTRSLSGNCAGVRCEFFENDPPGKPFLPHIQDPGAGFLTVWVRDLDALLARLRSAHIEIVTAGGRPVNDEHTRSIMVRDLSGGFYVTLMQAN
jgi:catechol 2,3-dioxygenase-like lactoylglutathione lyase family enzyme